jgi:lysophospholipase L1-like esterase
MKLIIAVFMIVITLNRIGRAQEIKTTDSVEIKKALDKETKAKKAYEEWLKFDWPNLKKFRDDIASNTGPGSKTEYSKDGAHHNMVGYKVMEPMVGAAIAKALEMK